MRIIEALTKQHSKTALRAAFSTVHSVVTHKATIGSEEQVRVGTGQAGQHVKSHTIDGREDGGRETRLGEELYPVGVMVIRHVL
jgi:hypothetical protein